MTKSSADRPSQMAADDKQVCHRSVDPATSMHGGGLLRDGFEHRADL
jgi:hypothetical protein